MCQQSLEKLLKAHLTRRTAAFPPRIHSLARLAELAGVELSQDDKALLKRLSLYYRQSRYPPEIQALAKNITRSVAIAHMAQREALWKWLRRRPCGLLRPLGLLLNHEDAGSLEARPRRGSASLAVSGGRDRSAFSAASGLPGADVVGRGDPGGQAVEPGATDRRGTGGARRPPGVRELREPLQEHGRMLGLARLSKITNLPARALPGTSRDTRVLMLAQKIANSHACSLAG